MMSSELFEHTEKELLKSLYLDESNMAFAKDGHKRKVFIQTQVAYQYISDRSILDGLVKDRIEFVKGEYTVNDFKKFFYKNIIDSLFDLPNVEVASLPVFRMDGKAYWVQPYPFDEIVEYMKNGNRFAIYCVIKFSNGRLVIRGSKL